MTTSQAVFDATGRGVNESLLVASGGDPYMPGTLAVYITTIPLAAGRFKRVMSIPPITLASGHTLTANSVTTYTFPINTPTFTTQVAQIMNDFDCITRPVSDIASSPGAIRAVNGVVNGALQWTATVANSATPPAADNGKPFGTVTVTAGVTAMLPATGAVMYFDDVELFFTQ